MGYDRLKNNNGPGRCTSGKNIYLRTLRLSDVGKDYCGWLNDPLVNRYLESRFEKWSRGKLMRYVQKVKRDKDSVFFAIVTNRDGRHIGNIKLGPINRRHKFADIGVMIGDRAYWGKGYASEAIRLVSDYAFGVLKLHKLTAGSYADNIGSIKAFKKVGFSAEGRRKKHYLSCGRYVDLVLLGKVRP